jgi:hypothetical protein
MRAPVIAFLKNHRRKLIWAVSLLLAYTIIGFFILPLIVRSVAIKQIHTQLDREASIRAVKINPFTLSASIQGLLIKDHDGEPFVSWDEVYVNFQLSSFFGKAWVFKEISTSKPFVGAQLNKDGSFNFSDLINKFSTNSTPKEVSSQPAKPIVVNIGRLHIGGAVAAMADFTPREPFKRTVGPIDITLDNFRTDPENKNPYAFTGTTDAGEQLSWSGYFYLDPLRSAGELKLYNFAVNKYAPLYQDLVSFEVNDGTIALDVKYRLEWSATNHLAAVDDTAFALRNFKLSARGATNPLAELPLFSVNGANVDLQKHIANIGSVAVMGGNFYLQRDHNQAINVLEAAKPSDPAAEASGGILYLLRSVTNVVTLLLNSTNHWAGTVNEVSLTNCAVRLEDNVNSRPARLDLDDITFTAKNLSNLPGTNLTADLALRWNTNGTVHLQAEAGFQPPTATVQIDLEKLDFNSLDPYLEPKVNLFLLGSQLDLHGLVQLRTPSNGLPEVTFIGNTRLNDFRTVDGVAVEDLLKWKALRFDGIYANLSPPIVAIQQITVDEAYARLVIETNRTINLMNVLRLTNSPATNQIKVAATTQKSALPHSTNSTLPKITIGAIVFTNTSVRFTDRSLPLEVNLSIQQLNGHIAGLSSEELQHADIDLEAQANGLGPVKITGRINPFGSAMTNDLKISVSDVDLAPVSPYAAKFAGYQIAQGKLNLDLIYQLIGKKLTSKNVITLDHFTFGEAVDSPDATHLPVRLAVAILKDREGKIVLDVPIDGSIDDPQFRIGKVVTRAVLNILTKVATSPFSLLGAAFGGGAEELGWQEFAPGSADLSPAGKEKLDALAKALAAKPALQLELSGSIQPASDREGLQRAALDRQMRNRLWLALPKSDRARTNAEALTLAPDEREIWLRKFYNEALVTGKITPQVLAANTNLAAYVAELPRRSAPLMEKGATRLMNASAMEKKKSAAAASFKTQLNPRPTPEEAILMSLVNVSVSDLAALTDRRAQAVQQYLVQTGQVSAARIFLKQGPVAGTRNDGSRAYLQFR